jgi:hypothetical protein
MAVLVRMCFTKISLIFIKNIITEREENLKFPSSSPPAPLVGEDKGGELFDR